MMVAMRYGLARGIYANEAGYGTAAVAYGTARSERAAAAGPERGDGGLHRLVRHLLDQRAHDPRERRLDARGSRAPRPWPRPSRRAIPVVGGWIVAFCAFLFGYTTLIGWAYYGEQFLEYVFGPRDRPALSLGLLRPHRVRRDQQGRTGLGLGRPHERPADLSRTSWASSGLSGVVACRPRGTRRRTAAKGRERLRAPRRRALLRRTCPWPRRPRTPRHAALRLQPRRRRRAPTTPTPTAFAAVPHRICYALKANGSGAILRLLAALGAGADIVSGGELRAALRAGFPPERIVFSGVGKTDDEIAPRPRGRDRRVQRRERGGDRAARRAGRGARTAGPRHPAREPRHRPALASLHLDRPAREQVRRGHRGRAAAILGARPRRARHRGRGRAVPHRLADAGLWRRCVRRRATWSRSRAAPARRGLPAPHHRHRRRPRRRLRGGHGARRRPPSPARVVPEPARPRPAPCSSSRAARSSAARACC